MNSKCNFSIPLLLFRQLRFTIPNIYQARKRIPLRKIYYLISDVVSPKNGDG